MRPAAQGAFQARASWERWGSDRKPGRAAFPLQASSLGGPPGGQKATVPALCAVVSGCEV